MRCILVVLGVFVSLASFGIGLEKCNDDVCKSIMVGVIGINIGILIMSIGIF